ncbi:hypothetical protein BpHYR1_013409 [Brachionus plicatilis]|uniref:Uncharacterized protein n=1 Tax=Brachionus plicatilis TaxID=10195 RepID=A0A3M7PEP2_BRAPC|nr:hypothetical protein BpHYR1_013409 [Brachionus plicatilis]
MCNYHTNQLPNVKASFIITKSQWNKFQSKTRKVISHIVMNYSIPAEACDIHLRNIKRCTKKPSQKLKWYSNHFCFNLNLIP